MKYPIVTMLVFIDGSGRKVITNRDGHYTLMVTTYRGGADVGYNWYYTKEWVENSDNYRLDEKYIVSKILTKYTTKEII